MQTSPVTPRASVPDTMNIRPHLQGCVRSTKSDSVHPKAILYWQLKDGPDALLLQKTFENWELCYQELHVPGLDLVPYHPLLLSIRNGRSVPVVQHLLEAYKKHNLDTCLVDCLRSLQDSTLSEKEVLQVLKSFDQHYILPSTWPMEWNDCKQHGVLVKAFLEEVHAIRAKPSLRTLKIRNDTWTIIDSFIFQDSAYLRATKISTSLEALFKKLSASD